MKAILVALALVNLFLQPPGVRAQEEKDLPSQKTKEAIEKFKKAPGVVGQTLESLREAGKAKLQGAQTKEGQPPAKAGEGLVLPEKKPAEPQTPPYSAAGRRDPFQPFLRRSTVGPTVDRSKLPPLEQKDVGQFKLVGIIWNVKNPQAMVEDTDGRGFIIKVGTPIGANEGKVKTIKPGEVVVEEKQVDFYGAKKVVERSMKLPVEP